MTGVIPINVDRNISVRAYDAATAGGELLITSTFYTFQGEGPYAGWPAIFIRLAGCNIGAKEDCPWCDTKFHIDDAAAWDGADISHLLTRYPQAKCVVVTGGEPLLQWPVLRRIMAAFQHQQPGLQWQIETNGMLLRQNMVEELWALHATVVMSPKVPHNHNSYRPLPSLTFAYDPEYPVALALKYVVTADPGSPYHGVPLDALAEARKGTSVYVSGMAVYKRATEPGEIANIWDNSLIDQQATARNYSHAAQLALRHGLFTCFQTHLFGGVE